MNGFHKEAQLQQLQSTENFALWCAVRINEPVNASERVQRGDTSGASTFR
jgi:hypothetical protein